MSVTKITSRILDNDAALNNLNAGVNITFTKPVLNPTITDYTETLVDRGNTGTAMTLSINNGTVSRATLTGNCTFTMPSAVASKSFTLFLDTGVGSFTATFTGVKWQGNVAPIITTTANRRDIISFISDGTAWYGTIAQNFTP